MCKLYGSYHYLCKCFIGKTLLCSDIRLGANAPEPHENYNPQGCPNLDLEEVILHEVEGRSCAFNLQLCSAPLHASIYANENASTTMRRNLVEGFGYLMFGIYPQPEYEHDKMRDLDSPQTKMKLEVRKELFGEVVGWLNGHFDEEFREERDRKRWRPTYLQDCNLSGVVGMNALMRWKKGCNCEVPSQRKQKPAASSREPKDYDRDEEDQRLNLDIVEGMSF